MSSNTSLFCRARGAGFFWLLTILAGTVALMGAARFGVAANVTADFCYAVASVLMYGLLKPVDRTLSMVAAACGLAGVSMGLLAMSFGIAALGEAAFVFFGLQCLLIGRLILRSTFLPRFVGGLMAFGGIGWLTLAGANLLAPPVAAALTPWILFPGILGEASLTLWLLAMGVNAERWHAQARSHAHEVRIVPAPVPIPL